MGNDSPSNPGTEPPPPPAAGGLASFWAELKRRKVVRVAVTYAVVAWLIIQIASTTFEGFGIPVWAFRFVMLCVIMGFPLALIFTWAFELTPEGIQTTKSAREHMGDEAASESQQRKRNWSAYALGALLPTLIFGALALYFYFTRSEKVTPAVETTAHSQQLEYADKSIAVLPLENMSPDPENAFFADGVQEDILTNLSRIDSLDKVISRSSTLRYRGENRDLRRIGAELGVRYLLEGSVRRSGNAVRVTVQLIDASTDNHVWAETYDRTLDDIFAIQAEVSLKIADQLQAVLTPEEIAKIDRRPTDSQEAYDLYIKARHLIETAGAGAGDEKIEVLRACVAADPKFAEAWALLAHESFFWWGLVVRRPWISNEDADTILARAKMALELAESLAPDTPDVLIAKAMYIRVMEGDSENVLRILQRIIAIEPNHFYAQWLLSVYYVSQGENAMAVELYKKMLRTDPFSYRVNRFLALRYIDMRMWTEAYAVIKENITRGENLETWHRIESAAKYLESGDIGVLSDYYKNLPVEQDDKMPLVQSALISRNFDDALEHLSSLNQSEDFISLGQASELRIFPPALAEALVYFLLDRREQSRVFAEKARLVLVERSKLAHMTRRDWQLLAICYALEGNRDMAIDTLEKAHTVKTTSGSAYRTLASETVYTAIVYMVAGEHETAIDILQSIREMDTRFFLNRELDLWFIFDKLRGNPRFDALLQ